MMKLTRRMTCSRSGVCGMSLAQTWMVLLAASLLLVLIDLRVLWQQTDFPSSPSSSAAALQETLHNGYSHRRASSENVFQPPLVDTGRLQQGSNSNNNHGSRRSSARDAESLDRRRPKEKLDFNGLLAGIREDGVDDDGGGGDGVGGGGGRQEGGGAAERKEEEGEKEEEVVGRSENILEQAKRQEEKFLLGLRALKLKPHSKWIVLDVTSGKCTEVPTAPSGWKILAIGDVPSLKGCSSPTCTYLPPDLGSADVPDPPSQQSQTWGFRKNLAYLAAMSQGRAELLLDADCTTSLKTATLTLQFPNHKDHGPMYNESLLFNPYAYFGAWATVPRALSGSAVRAGSTNSWTYYVRDFDRNVLVKHGVSEMSRDAIPVREEKGVSAAGGRKIVGTRFDKSVPPVFMGQRSFSAAVPTASLYRPKAQWSLMLPCLIPSLRCHVLRQLLQQRLFRDLDAFSGFYQVPATSTSKTLNDAADELDPSRDEVDVKKLIPQFDAWKCSRGSSFFACVEELGDHLHRKKTLREEEVSLLKAWVKVLKKTGAAEPARVASPWRGVRKTSEVRVTLGSMEVRLESGGVKMERMMKTRLVDDLADRCNVSRKNDWFPVAQWRRPVIEDIVLIIVFNWNEFFWNNLPFTETMHRPFFKHIFYCVPNVDELLVDNKDDILRHVSFVEGLSDTWYFMYECVTIVARMNIQGVRGYLQIGDDTLTNSWKYLKAPRDTMWIPQGFTTMRADELKHRWDWYWWKKSRGRPAALHAMADLEKLSGLSSEQLLKLDPNYSRLKASKTPVTSFLDMYQSGKAGFSRMRPLLPGSEVWEIPTREEALAFMKNYYKVNRMSGRVKHRALDFFYIPQALINGWVKFTRHFLRRNVLIELAVPAIHYGLSNKSDVKYVSASSLWKRDRNVSYSFYDEVIFFLHPFKMKSHMEQQDSKSFFCTEYMSILFAELKRLVTG